MSRKGLGIVECLILIIVLVVSFSAMLATLSWGSRSYAFSRAQLESRMLLSCWAETLEAIFPDVIQEPEDAFEHVAKVMGGTWNAVAKTAIVHGTKLTAEVLSNVDGILKVGVKIERGEKDFESNKIFNMYSSATVPDDGVDP